MMTGGVKRSESSGIQGKSTSKMSYGTQQKALLQNSAYVFLELCSQTPYRANLQASTHSLLFL